MRNILIFYKGNYIEDLKVHHTYDEIRIEEEIEKWCKKHNYNPDLITWNYEKEPA